MADLRPYVPNGVKRPKKVSGRSGKGAPLLPNLSPKGPKCFLGYLPNYRELLELPPYRGIYIFFVLIMHVLDLEDHLCNLIPCFDTFYYA